jgi:hypothetical protein
MAELTPNDIISLIVDIFVLLFNLVESLFATYYTYTKKSYLTQHPSFKSFFVYFVKIFTDFQSIISIVGTLLPIIGYDAYRLYCLGVLLLPAIIRVLRTLYDKFRLNEPEPKYSRNSRKVDSKRRKREKKNSRQTKSKNAKSTDFKFKI